MRSSKKTDVKAFSVLLVLILAPNPARAADRQTAVVDEALSGDTVRLKGGKELRYIGLASDTDDRDAQAFNAALVGNKKVSIEWGPQIRDSKNRLLGYVFLEDGTFVNREILKSGHAKAKRRAPNLRYAEEFRRDELAARRLKKGLWAREPKDPRLNVEIWGDKFTKTYYYPNSPELDRVPEAQRVSFRSRVEAGARGYKPCHTCRGYSEESEAEAS